MKHIQTVSKSPVRAEDIPAADLMAFIIAILGAIAVFLQAKETDDTTT